MDAEQSGIAYQPNCLEDLSPGGLYVLRGPRRVGKTVAVRQAIAALIRAGANPRSIVWFAADGTAAKDLRTLAQNTAIPACPPASHRWWFIDEATGIRGDWPAQLKWLKDNDPAFRSATIVLTGSNAKGLSEAIGVLAGRRGQVTDPERTLLPMGFRTFVNLLDPQIAGAKHDPLRSHQLHDKSSISVYNNLLPWLDQLVQWWERYLRYGGFPSSVAALARGEQVPTWLVEALFDVIHRDTLGSKLAETETMALIDRIGVGLCSPSNTSSIARELGIGADALALRISDLRDGFLLWRCPQKDVASWKPLPHSFAKLYFTDPLIAALASSRRPETWSRPDLTAIAEQQIGLACRREIESRNPGSWATDDRLFYQRTPTRKEIDFVGHDLNPVAIEGKYVEDGGWASEAKTVEAAGYNGVLTTRNVLDCPDEPGRAWAIPAAFVAYLIDT